MSKCRDSNPGPFGPEPNALPNCATPRQADNGTRTHDLLITNQPLYQLSYIGTPANGIIAEVLFFVQWFFRIVTGKRKRQERPDVSRKLVIQPDSCRKRRGREKRKDQQGDRQHGKEEQDSFCRQIQKGSKKNA